VDPLFEEDNLSSLRRELEGTVGIAVKYSLHILPLDGDTGKDYAALFSEGDINI